MRSTLLMCQWCSLTERKFVIQERAHAYASFIVLMHKSDGTESLFIDSMKLLLLPGCLRQSFEVVKSGKGKRCRR